MRIGQLAGILLVLTSALAAGPPADLAPVLAEMRESALRSTVVELTALGSRAVGQPGNTQAATWLRSQFAGVAGLSVAPLAEPWRNVVATLAGSDAAATETYIVGAHYDSAARPPTQAPGATDDAAGVAIVLEMARVLSRHRPRQNVVFATFNAEEQGCAGSRAYVEEWTRGGSRPTLYLNFDSTAFDPEGKRVLDVISNAPAAAARQTLLDCHAHYDLGFTLVENQHACASDHTPFAEAGISAIATHQQVHGEHYHTARDTIDRVSFDYVLRNGRLGLALIATLAGVGG